MKYQSMQDAAREVAPMDYKAKLVDAVETLEFLVASSNCIPESAAHTGKTEEEIWDWFNAARDAMVAAKQAIYEEATLREAHCG